MRYLLRNVVRDAVMENRRRANPSLVCRRPMIGGKPFPPNAIRTFVISDFTPELLNEIEHHQNAGNVQLLLVGRTGGEANIDDIRKQLGFPYRKEGGERVAGIVKEASIPKPPAKPTAPPPKVEVKVGDVQVAVSPGEDKQYGTEDDVVEVTPAAASKAPPLPPPSDGMKIDDILEEADTDSEAIPYTAEELASLKKDDLISIYAKVVGGPYTGKSKTALAEGILKAQGK